ncbi:hypothetical protein N8343_05380 [Akkermansiaceae bacterium]|nr:hypothetical protein [Akkermansiaceae bacterium]
MGEELEGDEAVERFLARFVDSSHAAFSDELDDFEIGEGCCDFIDGGRLRGRLASGGGIERLGEQAAGAEAGSGAIRLLVEGSSAGGADEFVFYRVFLTERFRFVAGIF